MKKLTTALLATVCAVLIASCALFAPATEKVGSAVKEYCKQPLEARRLVRAEVNKYSAPHTALITCDGDLLK